MPAPPSSATWSSTRSIPRATTWTSTGGIAGSAATGRSRSGCCRACRAGRPRIANPLSALSRWKIFDNLRRSLVPPPCCCSCSAPGCSSRNWAAWERCWCSRSSRCPAVPALVGRVAQAGGSPVGDASAGRGGVGGRQLGQILLTLVSAVRRLRQSRRDRRTLLRSAGDAQAPARVADLERCRTRPRAPIGRLLPTMWIAPVVARWRRGAPGGIPADQARFGAADPGASGSAAPWIAWWISQPIDRPSPDLSAEQLAVSPPHRAQDLAFLRDLCHRAGELAAAGQFSGSAHADDRLAHVADQHGAGAARQSRRPRLRLSLGWASDPAHAGHASPRCTDSNGIGGISTTGMTPAPSSRCCRSMCRVWTAATSPAIC
jgi:hypothetical protein